MLEFSKIDKDFLEYKSSNVYLFGAGKVGEHCKDILERKGVSICGFIDNNTKKTGTNVLWHNYNIIFRFC